MIELPEIAEVRTVAKTLNKNIVGRKIISIETPYDKIIKSNKKEFINTLINKTLKSVSSYGKWLLFDFGEYTMLSHLRMEGKYFIKPSNEKYDKHEHIIFHLDNSTDLRYHDVRKFGVMILCKTNDIFNLDEISKLGFEPDDEKLTKEYLYNKINKSNKHIKELLLDQSIINGLGNIYVDEVLFASLINPERLGKTISLDECQSIIENSKKIIKKATECGGCTIRSYTSSLGVIGHYQDYLKVHTKANDKCPKCNNKIIKIRVGGRGTYLCTNCQK
ncbi:MAG: DNA-formamidopyrimidine glycosylase [Firmicutes bacterium]|nr:DNA-formamidopyrimidine glycosylase [Bacillota bacterium]